MKDYSLIIKVISVLLLFSALMGCQIPYYDAETVQNSLKQDQPTSNFITVASKKMHYVSVGNEQSDNLIIFVHGSPGGWEAYGDYLKDEDLKKSARLISVDRLGFGQSNPGVFESSLQQHGDAIAAIIQKEKKHHKKVIIIGHSYGGPVVSRLTMDHPELINGIILAAPSISPAAEKRRWYNKAASLWLVRLVLPQHLDISNKEIIPLKGELNKMSPDWGKIKVPVTVIQGTKDTLVPKENATFAKEVLVNANTDIILLEDQGHFVIWEQYDLMKQTILKMIQTKNDNKL